MKNIETLMADAGINLADEAKSAFISAVNENYKTVAEVEKKDAKIKSLTEKVALTEESLKAFEGVDIEATKKQVADLQKALADKDAQYTKDLADRDFNALLTESISTAKGLNAKAITALLDVEALKKSQNQREDIAKALKDLSEREDSKMLFEVTTVSGRNPIGSFTEPKKTTSSRDIKYKDNPWYHPNTK